MTRTLAHTLASAILAMLTPTSINQAESKGPQIVYHLTQSSRLRAVLQIASDYRIPLGLEFGSRPSLCQIVPSISIEAPNAESAISQAISPMNYILVKTGEALVITSKDQSEVESRILNFRFGRFSATRSTIDDAGALLNGYIFSEVFGGGGFATNTTSPLSSRIFDLRLKDISTRDIASRIVSEDGHGLWWIHAYSDRSQIDSGVFVHVVGYSDKGQDLVNIPCLPKGSAGN